MRVLATCSASSSSQALAVRGLGRGVGARRVDRGCCSRRCRVSAGGKGGEEEPPDLQEDVRDFRARLIAQERQGDEGDTSLQSGDGGWIYETPLIEQGSVLLGGTKQKFGFGLRQQYFHKCVLLLVQHDAAFTKGIILNRPTSIKYQGWDAWFGGDVQEGGMFRSRPHDASSAASRVPAEVMCLHRLELPEARAASTEVIKNIYSCTFEEAQALVGSGKGVSQSDFWVFIGYCGWAPNQLQGELERDSWYMAAADSSVLLNGLLTLAADPASLPQLTEGDRLADGGDGIATWERLMRDIGKGAEVDQPEQNLRNWLFEDQMLREWVRQKLTAGSNARQGSAAGGVVDVTVEVGTLLLSMPWPGHVLEQQYQHKALMIVVERTDNITLAVVLNRPTSTTVQLALEDLGSGEEISRRVRFGGEASVQGREVYTCILPSTMAPEGSVPLGSSGLSRIGKAMPSAAQCSCLQVVRGFVYWEGGVLEKQLAEGRYVVVSPDFVPWQDLWDLGEEGPSAVAGQDGQLSVQWTASSLGMEIWRSCFDAQDEIAVDSDDQAAFTLADLALLEWAKFFAA